MRRLVLALVVIACATFLCGCGGSRAYGLKMVMKRAPFDLNCPKERVNARFLSETLVGATGCGRRAAYILKDCDWRLSKSSCKAILNSPVQPREGGAP